MILNLGSEKWRRAKISAGLLLDSAITSYGNAVALGTLKSYFSNDSAESFYPIEDLIGIAFFNLRPYKIYVGSSISANLFGETKNKFALVGTWITNKTESVVGVAYSVTLYQSSAFITIFNRTMDKFLQSPPPFPLLIQDMVLFPLMISGMSVVVLGAKIHLQLTSARIRIDLNNQVIRKESKNHSKLSSAPTGWVTYISSKLLYFY